MKRKVKLGVIGVRDFKSALYENYSYITSCMEDYISQHNLDYTDISLIVGGSKGTESLVIQWAESKDIPVTRILPNITQFGQKKAFVVRNFQVVAESDSMLFFWDGIVEAVSKALSASMHMSKKASVYPLK